MIAYEAGKVFRLAAELGLWQSHVNQGHPISDDDYVRIISVLADLRDAAARHDLDALASAVDTRLVDICERRSEAPMGLHLQEISARFSSDLALERVCHLSVEERRLLLADYPFGEAAMKACPEIVDDAREAARSFALNRHTATVFHAMRVIELLARRLARRFKVRVGPRDPLGKILAELDLKLAQKKSMRKSTHTFLSGGVAILRLCKDGRVSG